jgi:hypothetical protein
MNGWNPSELLKEFTENYVEKKGEGIDQFWIDYAISLERKLIWRGGKDDLKLSHWEPYPKEIV